MNPRLSPPGAGDLTARYRVAADHVAAGGSTNARGRSRHGFSLIEVIICVGLVGIMLIPLASMMKASAHAWQDAEADGGPDADVRTSARWVHGVLRSADGVTDVGKDWIEIDRSGGRWRITITSGQLWMRSGSQKILIADNVSQIEFSARRRPVTDEIIAVDFKLTGAAVAGAAPSVSTLVTLDPLKRL